MQQDNYYTTIRETASIISDNIDPLIISFFNNKIEKTDLYAYLESELQPFFMVHEQYNPNITLENVITYAIFDLLAECSYDAEEAGKKNASSSYSRKRYLRDLLISEANGVTKSTNPPLFLKKSYDALKIAQDTNMELPITFSSYEEYVNYRLDRMAVWCSKNSNPVKYLFEFDFFTYLEPKKQISYFLIDVATNAFNIINNKFYSNPESGYLTKFPQELIDLPVFSLSAYRPTLSYEVQDDRILVYEVHNIDANTQLRLVMAEFAGNYKNMTEEEKRNHIRSLKDDPEAALNTLKSFDAKDVAILANIYSHINGINIEDESFHAKCYTFMKGIYQEIAPNGYRTRDYEDFSRRLRKLATYAIDKVVYDKNKMLLSVSNMNFLNYTLTIPNGDDHSDFEYPTETTIVVSSNVVYSPSVDFSKVKYNQLQNAELEIIPAKYMKDQWRKATNALIYTKYYNKIETNKGKALIHVLQVLRLRHLTTLEAEITLNYFKQKLYITGRPARFIKELRTELDVMAESGIIIANYHIYDDNRIYLKFLPLSATEKKIYNLPSHTLTQNDDISE